MIDPEKLQKFFQERPAISVAAVEREANLPNTKIKEFLKGNQKLSLDQDKSLSKVLEKYGSIVPPERGLSTLLVKSLIEKEY